VEIAAVAEKRRFLDVWIVESNTVYKEVPFTVVIDWVQQGRLLEDDKMKPTGTKEWQRLGDSPDFTPYLPQADPGRPEDEAEAMEPVVLDFEFKKPHFEEDDDVDMIPLIDVSLVLLVFFMLTASAAGAIAFVETPETENGEVVTDSNSLRVDINRDPTDHSPVFALGVGVRPATKEDSDLTAAELLEHLRTRLNRTKGEVELVINAHKDLPAKFARDLLVSLRDEPFRSKITVNFFGVSERAP
jgi:biopolymer transport protein ExbD